MFGVNYDRISMVLFLIVLYDMRNYAHFENIFDTLR